MTELRCDFDGEIPQNTEWRVRMLVEILELTVVLTRFDRTKHGYHMVLVVNEYLTPTEIVLCQSLLGSDWKREMYNARRARFLSRQPAMWRRAPRWNVLYNRHVRGVTL